VTAAPVLALTDWSAAHQQKGTRVRSEPVLRETIALTRACKVWSSTACGVRMFV
jgi:hypothetical protein